MAEAVIAGSVFFALLLTAFAGLSTGVGSAIAYFIKKPKLIYLSFFMGFSGGVMIYVSFVELFQGAVAAIGQWLAVAAFFLGMVLIGAIDFVIPETHNPHTHAKPGSKSFRSGMKSKSRLLSIGLFTALAIGIHNFPEGLATFATALVDIKIGLVIAIAIAIHNIPEGISVSIPIFYATGNRKKAFMYSFLSGLAEPVGAMIGFLVLMPFMSPMLVAFLMALVAGIMVYISLDKILPAANNYGHSHTTIIGLSLGMLVMALSLLMLL